MKKLITLSGLMLILVIFGSVGGVYAETLGGYISNASSSNNSVVLTIIPQSSATGLWDPKALDENDLTAFSGACYYGHYTVVDGTEIAVVDGGPISLGNPYKVQLADKQVKLFFEAPVMPSEAPDNSEWVHTDATITIGNDVVICTMGPGFAFRRTR